MAVLVCTQYTQSLSPKRREALSVTRQRYKGWGCFCEVYILDSTENHYIRHTLICFMLAADRAVNQTIDFDLSTHEEVINPVR